MKHKQVRIVGEYYARYYARTMHSAYGCAIVHSRIAQPQFTGSILAATAQERSSTSLYPCSSRGLVGHQHTKIGLPWIAHC